MTVITSAWRKRDVRIVLMCPDSNRGTLSRNVAGMRPKTMIDPVTMSERCYTLIKSLHEFDSQEVRGVLRAILAKTEREKCVEATYYRAAAHVGTLLSLKSAKDLQAIAMVARGLFELAVDAKLIGAVQNASTKIVAFTDVEKLRAARRIVAYKAAHPDAAVAPAEMAAYESFIAGSAAEIDSTRETLWPGVKTLRHWSGLDLAKRAAMAGAPFDEIYQLRYAEMSWYAHSGLMGFAGLPASTFDLMAARQNKRSGECFVAILSVVIDEFALEKGDATIRKKLDLARMLPFTDGPGAAQALRIELLG